MMFLSLAGLIWFVHHIVVEHTTEPSVVSAAHDMMVGFGAALLAVLSGSSSRQQMADRIDTALGPQKGSDVANSVNVQKVETVNVSTESK